MRLAHSPAWEKSMARPTRVTRYRTLDLTRLTAGDFAILGASALLFLALFVNWWANGQNVNALEHSSLYVTVSLVLLLVTVVLVIYPTLEPEFDLPPLPFATPLVLLGIGLVVLIMAVFELGRYIGVDNVGITPGIGPWLAIIASAIYLLGATVKWGSRPRHR